MVMAGQRDVHTNISSWMPYRGVASVSAEHLRIRKGILLTMMVIAKGQKLARPVRQKRSPKKRQTCLLK